MKSGKQLKLMSFWHSHSSDKKGNKSAEVVKLEAKSKVVSLETAKREAEDANERWRPRVIEIVLTAEDEQSEEERSRTSWTCQPFIQMGWI